MMLENEGGTILKDIFLYILIDAFADEAVVTDVGIGGLRSQVIDMCNAADVAQSPVWFARMQANGISKTVTLAIWKSYFVPFGNGYTLRRQMLGGHEKLFVPTTIE